MADLTFSRAWSVISDNWKTFTIVGAVAALLSGILSGPTFISPRYLSSSIVYPVNLQSYSTETRTDQLLQLFESNSIRDSLIQKFGLVEAYEIDTSEAGSNFRLYNEFNDRVTISKTRYESVQIEVEDEDPQRAQAMVLEMIDQLNLLARRLQREKSEELLEIAERALVHESYKLDSVEAVLGNMRQQYGLLAYDQQSEELVKGYVKALGTSPSKADQIKKLIEELEEKGGEFRTLTALSDAFRNNYDRLLTGYEQAVSDVTKELTYTNTVLYPELPDKKVYPIRWLIVLLSVVSALFFCYVLIMMRGDKPA
jgi:capsule polysaccharide export protein KpsE/RkpR